MKKRGSIRYERPISDEAMEAELEREFGDYSYLENDESIVNQKTEMDELDFSDGILKSI